MFMMMNFKLRRVPLDFDWKLNKTWKGYINPHPNPVCSDCKNGWTKGAFWLSSTLWIELLLSIHDLHRGKIHPWRIEHYVYDDILPSNEIDDFIIRLVDGNNGTIQNAISKIIDVAGLKQDWGFNDHCTPTSSRVLLEHVTKYIVSKGKHEFMPFHPSYDMVSLCNGLVGHEQPFLGYTLSCGCDATSNLYKHLGFKHGWDICKTCNGMGHVPSIKHKKWKWFNPPEGKGYQLWETTSEGSPITPVFKTINDLIDWLAEHKKYITFTGKKINRNDWESILKSNCSAIVNIIDGNLSIPVNKSHQSCTKI